MLQKSFDIFVILSGGIFAMAISQALEQSNFPYASSLNFGPPLSGTPYRPVLSSSTEGSKFTIPNLATGSPSSPSAITKLATTSSAPQPATTGLLTYTAASSASAGLATGPSPSQPATNVFAASSSVSQPATNVFAASFSVSQPAANVFAASPSVSQLAISSLVTPQQSVSEANGIQQLVIPTLTDPVAQHFADSLFKAFVSNEAFKNFVDLEFRESSKLFFDYGSSVLSNAGIQDHELADIVVQAVESRDKLPVKLYLSALANTLSRFLFSKHILTPDNESLYYQKLIDLVDKYSISRGVQSIDSILIITSESFFELLFSIDAVSSSDDFRQLFPLFAQELRS